MRDLITEQRNGSTTWTSDYAYDAQDRVTSVTTPNGTVSYTYDPNGNRAAMTTPTGSSSYVYDADGRRVQQTANGQVMNYLWDELSTYGDVVLETDGSGTTLASYLIGNGHLVSQNRGGSLSYYLHDGQNNARALASSIGDITDTYSYMAFGELTSHIGSASNVYLSQQQQFDSLTGLYNVRARYYNPSLGRFIARDTFPVNFQDPIELNRYHFAWNNPINKQDPTGLSPTIDYGNVTLEQEKSANEQHTAYVRAFAKDEQILTDVELREMGQKLATDARYIVRDVRADLISRGFSPAKMKSVTIAVGEENGANVYAVNGSIDEDVYLAIKDIVQADVVKIEGLHAEVALTQSYSDLEVIAVSNSRGVCIECQQVIDIPVYYLGRLFIAIIAGV